MIIHCKHDKLIPLADIHPHPNNENKHPESQVEVLAKIIAKDGMRHPIIVSNLSGYIVAGHGRLEALKLLGEEVAPIVFQDFDDSIQELRVRTADNNIQNYSEMDRDQFNLNLAEFELEIGDIDFEEFGLMTTEFKLDADKDDLGDDFEDGDGPKVGNGKQTICPNCGTTI